MFEEVAPLNTSGNRNISNNVWLAVARHIVTLLEVESSDGAPLKRFTRPLKANSSLSRATICDATKMLAEKHPLHFGSPCSRLAF